VQGVALLGDKRGTGPDRLTRPTEVKKEDLVAEVRGFNMHGSVVVDGRDRPRLERVVRDLARPPIAAERSSDTVGVHSLHSLA
jgi:hypothetical protein